MILIELLVFKALHICPPPDSSPQRWKRLKCTSNTIEKAIPIPNKAPPPPGEQILLHIHICSLVSISFRLVMGPLYTAAADTVSTSIFGSGADLPPRSVVRALGFLV